MGTDRGRGKIPVATIRANCPTCGDVDLMSCDVTVRLCADDNQGSYVFRCPDCEMAVAKAADAQIVDLLVASGVRLVVWALPAELHEPHEGPAITYDDLLDFHYAIQQPGWFQRLTATSSETPAGGTD
jgi:hypothetical protein